MRLTPAKEAASTPILSNGYFSKIARTFSRDWGVTVEINGDGAFADLKNKKINLPATADFLEGEGRKALEGLLDHETAHIRAEFEASSEAARPSSVIETALRESDRLKHFVNVYEDARIEFEAGAKWIGVRDNLEAKGEFLLKIARTKSRSEPLPAIYLLTIAILGRVRGIDKSIAWVPKETLELVDSLLADEIRDARTQTSALDALDLARRTLAKLKEAGEDPKPEPDKGKGDGKPGKGKSGAPKGKDDKKPAKSDSGDEKTEDKGDEKTGGEGGDPKETDDGEKDGTGEPGDGEGDDPEGTGDGGEPAGDPEISDEAREFAGYVFAEHCPKDGVDSLLKAEIEKLGRLAASKVRKRYLPHPRAAKQDRVINVPPNVALFEGLYREVSTVIAGLSSRLAFLLRSEASKRVNDRESGRIDSRALASVRAGNRRVFTEDLVLPGLDVAVLVLLDQSGSMHGGPARRANMTGIAIGEALDRAGVPFALYGWSEDSGRSVMDSATEWEKTIFTRYEPQIFRSYKHFGEAWRTVRARLGEAIGSGNNDDAGAVRKAAGILLSYKARRRILLVLSDGEPAHAGCVCHDVDEALRDAIADVEKAGIEVGGIGIETDCVRKYYKISETVNNTADLAPKTLGVLKRLLLNREARQRRAA